MLILARTHTLFDESRLQVKELPRSDGRADESREHQEIAGAEVQRGRHRFLAARSQSGLARTAEMI